MAAKTQLLVDAPPGADLGGAVADTGGFTKTLFDFCSGLSASDKRTEMIGAFYKEELRADRTHGTEAQFQARFLAFTKKPV